MNEETFLARWSRRKLASEPEPEPAAAPSQPEEADAAPSASVAAIPVESEAAADVAPELPDIKTLTPESDFRPFLNPKVAPELRNQALKTLFKDPRFNVMDRLDTYIDDYSLPDPIPIEMLKKMAEARDWFVPDPPEPLPGETAREAGKNADAEEAAAAHPSAGQPDLSQVNAGVAGEQHHLPVTTLSSPTAPGAGDAALQD